VTATGNAVGSATSVAATARFEVAWFDAPEVVAHVTELGLSAPDEMAAIAEAWRQWGTDPAACFATLWFTALAWAP
jgi:hypothetical protein